MKGRGGHSSGNVYFTVAYILMTIVIVAQVFYYCFTVYTYQSLKKKIIAKGRLLQVFPVISIATVSQNPMFAVPSATPPPPAYPGVSVPATSGCKDIPPPYTP